LDRKEEDPAKENECAGQTLGEEVEGKIRHELKIQIHF
jgi:hypothetical protein